MSGKKKGFDPRTDPLCEMIRGLPGVTEDVKWGDNLVFSVANKMFVVFQVDDGEPFSFKVDPIIFDAMTQREGIEPAPYMARNMWVWVATRGHMPADEIEALIKESHALVADKLSRKARAEIGLADEA